MNIQIKSTNSQSRKHNQTHKTVHSCAIGIRDHDEQRRKWRIEDVESCCSKNGKRHYSTEDVAKWRQN